MFIWRRLLFWMYSNSIQELDKKTIMSKYNIGSSFSQKIMQKLVNDGDFHQIDPEKYNSQLFFVVFMA
jgi:hypothetical protein